MKRNEGHSLKYVIGPDGTVLTLADLPSPKTKRWVIRRKVEVVDAVQGGLLSLQDACDRYNLTMEEFRSWQRQTESYRAKGKRPTQLQGKAKP